MARLRSLLPVCAGLLLLAACGEAPTDPTAIPALSSHTPAFTGCRQGVQGTGALYEICVPEDWNGDLVVWAHGYRSVFTPIAVPDDQVDGRSIADIITGLGYAYAASSYRTNGLAANVASLDILDLVPLFAQQVGVVPANQYLVGASEGSLASTLTLERAGQPFDGGILLCGPLGTFRGQVNYFGDFRLVFDYFFPGVIPGSPTNIPPLVQLQFASVYLPAALNAVAADPVKTGQLIRVTGAAVDPRDPTTIGNTVASLLFYSVFATNDANAKLGGNPLDNRTRVYRGSLNDAALNAGILRVAASPAALAAMSAFETSGRPRVPVVNLHTILDPVVPFWQQTTYEAKVQAAGFGARLVSAPALRYGHCAFKESELLAAFAVMIQNASGQNLVASASAFRDRETEREFLDRARELGARPTVIAEEALAAR